MSMDFNSKQPPEYNEIYGKRVRTSHCVAFSAVVGTLLIVSTYFVMNMQDWWQDFLWCPKYFSQWSTSMDSQI